MIHPRSFFWFFALLAAAFFHIGFFGIGRPLFFDEAVLIDGGVSLLTKGWMTFRTSPVHFDSEVSTGVLGLILPGAATYWSGSYVWGRAISALQNIIALIWIGQFLLKRVKVADHFLTLVLLIPAVLTLFVYCQGEILSFAALLLGVSLWAERRRYFLAGIVFFICMHLKLVALLDVAGAFTAWAILAAYNKKLTRREFLNPILAGIAGLGFTFVLWQVYQLVMIPSAADYWSNWKASIHSIISGQSGIAAESGNLFARRWELLSSPASELGSFGLSSKLIIAFLLLSPWAAWIANLKNTRKNPIFVMLMVASAFHTAWWLLKSQSIWVRHGYVGILCGAFCCALYSASFFERRKLVAWILPIALCTVAGLKTVSAFKEFYAKTPGCGELLVATYGDQDTQPFPNYCISSGKPLEYRDWSHRPIQRATIQSSDPRFSNPGAPSK